MLEVDVDVGRLVALAADEAFEQQAAVRRIDGGDAQAIADRGIRRRAAALTEDAAFAGEGDEVGDGQEVRLVAQLGDQCQLALDLLADRFRRAGGIAALQPLQSELAQPAGRRLVRRDDLLGVFVAQLIEREATARGEPDGFLEKIRRIALGEPQPAAQVLLGIGSKRESALGKRLAEPDGGQGVVQALAGAAMIVDVAGSHQRQADLACDIAQHAEQCGVVAAGEQLGGEPAALSEALAYETGLREQAPMRRGLDERRGFRDEQGEAARDAVGKIGRLEPVAALGGPHPGAGDELGEIAVALAVGREQDQAGIVLGPAGGSGQGDAVRTTRPDVAQREFGPDHQGQAACASLQMGAHDPRKRAFVGDRERCVTERLGPVDEFLGVGCAAQEREVRDAVQLGIGSEHREPVRQDRKRAGLARQDRNTVCIYIS